MTWSDVLPFKAMAKQLEMTSSEKHSASKTTGKQSFDKHTDIVI